MEPFQFDAGTGPLLVSMPHVGTHLPEVIDQKLTVAARGVPDTDWHVHRLYDFLGDLGAGVLSATHSRYVIDLNRAPDDKPLYAGASNTELCPTTTFDEEPVYEPGQAPDEAEIAARLERFWQPYHHRLRSELQTIKARNGIAVLWDAHSIRSRVPRFFSGRLPDLNFGTGGGATASSDLLTSLERTAASSGRSVAVNGRFKGGYITRTYGDPGADIHAVQLELSQKTYMDEAPPYGFREDLAAGIRPILRGLLEAVVEWAERRARLGR